MHNIDSQIANEIASRCYDKYKWVIDIHDAFIVNPEAAADVRKWYGELMEELFSNRKQILRDFFLSVGIRASAQTAWNNLQKMIEPMETFKCNPMALK